MKMMIGIGALIAFQCTSRIAFCQVFPSNTDVVIANRGATTKPIPAHLLYRHFLAWASYLDKKAVAEGKADPFAFAEPFAKQSGLRNEDLEIVRREAESLEKDIAKQDANASAIIEAFRNEAKAALARGESMPPRPAKLKELQQERETLIRSHVAILKAALEKKAAANLDDYIVRDFGSHVSLRPIVTHRKVTPPDVAATPPQ